MSLKKLIPILFCFLAITSCVDNLDFSQIEDYSVSPEYTVSLTYFSILPFQFYNLAGNQESQKTDITDFRVFQNSYIRKNLVKVDFNVEIKNEFDRDFTLQIDFLNENMNLTHSFNELKVNANNLNYTFDETVEVRTNPNIKNTTRVRVIVIDNSSAPIDPSDTTEFDFKSSAKIYIDTDG